MTKKQIKSIYLAMLHDKDISYIWFDPDITYEQAMQLELLVNGRTETQVILDTMQNEEYTHGL